MNPVARRFGFLGVSFVVCAATACTTTPTQEQSTSPSNGAPPRAEAPIEPSAQPAAQPAAAAEPQEAPTLANPASERCVKDGGKIEIVRGPDGESGVCVFPDGSRCPEWEYFRGTCKKGERR